MTNEVYIKKNIFPSTCYIVSSIKLSFSILLLTSIEITILSNLNKNNQQISFKNTLNTNKKIFTTKLPIPAPLYPYPREQPSPDLLIRQPILAYCNSLNNLVTSNSVQREDITSMALDGQPLQIECII